jgi:hypothetical protein
VKNSGVIQAALTTIIDEGKLRNHQGPGLTFKMQTDQGTQTMFNRFNNANLDKGILKAL